MLSDHERRVLASIERGLTDEDRRFAESFGSGRPRAAGRRRRWPIRGLIGFGLLLIVVGLITGTDGLFTQGLLFGGAAILWARWRAKHPLGGTEGGQSNTRRLPPRPDPSPPGWFRQI
jgi:Protein of unknown function (DUF3040)